VAQQIKIADRVEQFVFDELVVVSQAIGIEHTVFVHHDRIIQAAAKARPCERMVSTSCMKPKVRARLTSLTYEVVEKSTLTDCRNGRIPGG